MNEHCCSNLLGMSEVSAVLVYIACGHTVSGRHEKAFVLGRNFAL
ncbi:MAG: hypothetical protein JWR87_336 [Segetibacter sp.]|jgi:hypothetical protein|nr:hypothetical protein [Segetibacter sp.]